MEVTQFKNHSSVLYLSGLFGGGWSWDEVIKHVYCANNIVIQDPLCAISNDPENLVAALRPVLSSIGVPVTIVGTSLGGLIAMQLACDMPEYIEQVVISDSAGFNVVDLGYPFDRHNIDDFSLKLANSIYHDPDKIRFIDLERLRETLRAHIRSVARLMNVGNKSLIAEDLLKQIEVPVRAIWGANDSITPLSAAELLFRRYGVEVNLIDNCGHSPMCEAPEEFAMCLNKLVSRQPMELQLFA